MPPRLIERLWPRLWGEGPVLKRLLLSLFWSALFVLAWRRMCLEGKVPVDGNVLRLMFPDWAFLHHRGSLFPLPLWNPFRNMGEPFLADPQSLAAYPGMWLLYPIQAYGRFVQAWIFLHSGMAALFMAGWVYRQFPDDAAAAGAALVISFNAFFMSHGLLLNHFASAAYLPAVLYFLSRRSVPGVAVVLGLQWLAGFPPFSALTVLVAVGVGLLLDRPSLPVLAKGGGLALGLTAFQWIPFVELLRLSIRPLFLDAAVASQFSEPCRQLLRMIFLPQWFALHPRFFGDPAILSFYVGPVVLVLAAWGVWRGGHRERVWAGLALFSAVLSLGAFLPGFRHVPLLHVFRYPAHWLLLTSLAFSFLFAAAIARLPGARWKWGVLAFTVVDLLAFAQYVRYPWFPPSFVTEPPSLARRLAADELPGRVFCPGVVGATYDRQILRTVEDYRFLKESMLPSQGMAFGVSEVNSYQVLRTRRAEAFIERLEHAGPSSPEAGWAEVSTVITLPPGAAEVTPSTLKVMALRGNRIPLFLVHPGAGDKILAWKTESGWAEAQVETSRPMPLVFSEMDYPCWQVSVNGRAAVPSRFDETFIAVKLPAGVSSVRFQYTSTAFTAGLLVTLLTLMGGLLGVVWRAGGLRRSF